MNAQEKKAYLAAYYQANKHKYKKRTPEQQAAYNATRRARYAENEEFREKIKQQAKVSPEKRRKTHLKSIYGLTPEQFDALMTAQSHACAICGHSEKSHRVFPMIDHCHTSGKVRGILCAACNHGLGKFKDNPEFLRKAIEYLNSNGWFGVS